MRNKLITFLLVICLLITAACPAFGEEVAKPKPKAPFISATVVSNGIKITWTPCENVDGYYISRRTDPAKNWSRFYTESSSIDYRVTNVSVENDTTYYYTVRGFNKDGKGEFAKSVSAYWLDPPEITTFIKSGNYLTVGWSPNEAADGYQLQYCRNRFFSSPGTINITDPSVLKKTIGNRKIDTEYYARVRAYTLDSEGNKKYSPWTLSDNAYKTKKITATRVKYNDKVFELRKLANQKVGSYDTLQGACRTSKYGYYLLYNRDVNKCKIAKVNLSTGKLVKLSLALKVSHGNDMTWNPDKGYLVISHCTPDSRKLSIVDPSTLKVKFTKTIDLKENMPGLSNGRRADYEGISAIAYNTKYNQYVARTRGCNDLLFLNQSFEPVRYVRITKKDVQVFQGMDSAGDYVLIGQSFKSSNDYNIISVYNWNGEYISKLNVRKGYELENIYHYQNTFHSGFYTSYYETYYLNGLKIQKEIGDNVKTNSKVKYTRLQRVNYYYKLTNL